MVMMEGVEGTRDRDKEWVGEISRARSGATHETMESCEREPHPVTGKL